jgi:hypothetical protein
MCATCGNQFAEIAVLLEEQYIFVISSLDHIPSNNNNNIVYITDVIEWSRALDIGLSD